jgi:hypothetical protein
MAKKAERSKPLKRVNGGKMGRPIMKINWKLAGEMCAAGCYGGPIAAALGISMQTLYDRVQTDHGKDFTTFRREHLAAGDDVLRKKQFELAKRGDKTMLIWLGKNRLGQKDRHDISGSAATPAPVINVVVQAPRTDGDSA